MRVPQNLPKAALKSTIFAAAAMLFPVSASAVIVGGTQGTGFNNAGASTLSAFLSTAVLPEFPYWDNLVRVHDASGIYLGYNPGTGQGWVLSVNHVAAPATITVDGVNYLVRSSQQVESYDLKLHAIGGSLGDPALPDLLSPAIMATPNSVGANLIMAGRGHRAGAGTLSEDTSAPYTWGTPGVNPSIPFRWGSNFVLDTGLLDSSGNAYFSTDFDAPSSPPEALGSPFDGQAAVGDSGGSGFVLRDGLWQLAGMMYEVDDGPDADAFVSPAGYGDTTWFVDLATYRTDILNITGSLIPEPSSVFFICMAVPILFIRSRRRVGLWG